MKFYTYCAKIIVEESITQNLVFSRVLYPTPLSNKKGIRKTNKKGKKMDTHLVCKKTKTLIAIFLSTVTVMGIVFFQNRGFAANEIRIAQGLIIPPIINSAEVENSKLKQEILVKERLKLFEENINYKYKRAGYNVIIKPIDIGIVHIKLTRTYKGRPVRLNVIELDKSLNPQLEVRPTLASDTLAHRSKIKTISGKHKTLAAVNGTYFKPQTGVPLGTLMIDKKLYTGPIYDRVAIGLFSDKYEMARVQFNGILKYGRKEIKIDNINQPRMLSSYVLIYSSDWGRYAPPSPSGGLQFAIENKRVKEISTQSLEIPKDGYVVVAPKSKIEDIKPGQKIDVNLRIMPEWEDVNHIVSGGPYLVKNGEVFVDMTEERLNAIGGRNPRTAIGYTADNHLILVTADGREGSSIGLTLTELGYFMKELGCINAMNLDGGGSTVMYVDGAIVNKPAVQGGITLSNAVTVIK